MGCSAWAGLVGLRKEFGLGKIACCFPHIKLVERAVCEEEKERERRERSRRDGNKERKIKLDFFPNQKFLRINKRK
jgi:hypothetical protein